MLHLNTAIDTVGNKTVYGWRESPAQSYPVGFLLSVVKVNYSAADVPVYV